MAEIKRNLAVVIGINQYSNGIPTLKTAVNDAKEIAHTLETKYQYQVLQLLDEDATGTHLQELFAAFEQQTLPRSDSKAVTTLEASDRLLFYFAGHGIALEALDNADGPVGFLVPQDARIDHDSSLLSMKRLHDALLALPCRHLLVILDCCFAGAFRWAGQREMMRSQKMYRERYERFISGCAQQVITSAADDEKAADALYRFGQRSEHEGHSPFAELLLKGLSGEADYSRDGVITATELYVYIHGELSKTNAKQTPNFCQLKRHDKGEYIFPIANFEPNQLDQAPVLDENANPYKGLESFEENDSDKFFGRKTLTEKLQEFVTINQLTVVLGASGSGKSSLVKAGLIPLLKHNQDWRILAPFRPGESPFIALNKALEKENLPVFALPNQVSNSGNNSQWYEQGLQNLSANLTAWRNLYPNSKLLLVIDQSEEVVTLCRSDKEREMFLNGLARALKAFPDWLRIVLTLRSDFEPQLRETALEPYWNTARFIVPAMTREELRQAIVEPASAKVMYFEPPTLVDQLIDEVVQMPGALPLLSFTLSELYLKYIRSVTEGKRNNRAITQEDYQELGGVARSLTQRADWEYDQLVKVDSAYEQTVRHVMLRMVAMGGGELARRRVFCTELEYPAAKNARVKEVIERFVAARLLVKGRDLENQEYVEPTHDVLVRGWQKLRMWKDQELGNLLLQRELTPTANKWATSSGDKKAVGLLWDNDPRLPLVRQILESSDSWLNGIESEFVQRSIQRRHNKRRWRIGLVSCGFAVVLGFAGIQWNQNQEAQTRSLAISSQQHFVSDQQLEALIEAIKAGKKLRWVVWAESDTTYQVASALQQAVFDWVRERNRLEEHIDGVNSISFSPDGKTLASASNDKTIKLWTLDGKFLRTLTGHNNAVSSVSFSPDGKTLASASNDKTIKLWSLDGKLLQTLKEHSDAVHSISFSPDGETLASASADKTIKVWRQVDGQILKTLKGHSEEIYSVSFSPDGKLLASASRDKNIKLWNLVDGKELRTLKGHSNAVYSVSFSADGKFLASASRDQNIKLWSLMDGKELRTLKGHSDMVYSVSFSPDGKLLASASRDKNIKLWSLIDGKELRTLKGHSNTVQSVSFSPDGKTLASASADKIIKLWGLDSKALRMLIGHRDAVNSVSFSPDGKTLASASWDSTIKLWSLVDGKEFRTLRKYRNRNKVNSISFSPDGKTLASANNDKTIKLWSLVDGKFLRKLTGHRRMVNSVSFSPDGKTLASASSDNTIKLWGLDGRELRTIAGHRDTVWSISFSPDGNTLASASRDKNIKLWSMVDGKLLKTLPEHSDTFLSVSFSPDGKLLASGSTDKTIKLWSIVDGKELWTLKGHIAPVRSVSFSPDGKTLASASWDRTIKLWSLMDGKELWTLKNHSNEVRSVSFSPDGKILASASQDQTILLWNLDLLNLEGLLRHGCDWVDDYLKTNPKLQADRHLCDGDR